MDDQRVGPAGASRLELSVVIALDKQQRAREWRALGAIAARLGGRRPGHFEPRICLLKRAFTLNRREIKDDCVTRAAERPVKSLEAVADRPAAFDRAEGGIVRRFLAFAQQADAEGRADAASALARAYLYSGLAQDARAEAELGLATVLDDPSALVRRALAEALASAADAPRHIVLALAADQAEVACVVLGRSPVLGETELVDCAAVGDALVQTAIARRPHLSAGAAAALAEIGQREAAVELIGNLDADLHPAALWRLFERFGDDAEMREALTNRPGLPAALRNELVGAAARALADFAARCDWLSAGRARRIANEARDQATATIAARADSEALAELARRMRDAGTLTVAVLMRALLSGERDFPVHALSELSGVALRRAQSFARHPDGHGFAALYAKAGLPDAFLPVFRVVFTDVAAIDAPSGERLSRVLCERAIAACEGRRESELAPLQSLLWRFYAEAARDSARDYADEAWCAPPLLEPARLERVNYEPLLIEAVAAALDDFEPPQPKRPNYAPLLIDAVAAALEGFEPPLDETRESLAPPVELTFAWLMGESEVAPAVQLPADMLAALAKAA
ncbi:MAG: DUF2336 domain-containing protein [Bradyrhizobium sp.]|nr:MAG: DUF2336 domain-containing protein [Bradyrhizobium sp.]